MDIKRVLCNLFVVILGVSLPQKGTAAALPLGGAPGKAFAVFVASYNADGLSAVGGVAGTAFFISPTKAITAFHVLQDKSFRPAPGFQRVRVWLVHENYPAIELKPEQLSYKSEMDSSVINLDHRSAVPAKYIFAMNSVTAISNHVESEGFMANSTGPILEKRGADLVIVSVPKLERMKLNGTVLQHSQIDLRSSDLNLKGAPMVQLSYQPIKGFSGGPVTSQGKVIGMNSFADPNGNGRTWALQVTNSLLN